mmetsp:Transcript_14252/g.44810  ORF Transcript_14252/g.44810 Transcript_14252/m.44810 type:complete len:226 (-) Transcript_14252:8-685(-)
MERKLPSDDAPDRAVLAAGHDEVLRRPWRGASAIPRGGIALLRHLAGHATVQRHCSAAVVAAVGSAGGVANAAGAAWAIAVPDVRSVATIQRVAASAPNVATTCGIATATSSAVPHTRLVLVPWPAGLTPVIALAKAVAHCLRQWCRVARAAAGASSVAAAARSGVATARRQVAAALGWIASATLLSTIPTSRCEAAAVTTTPLAGTGIALGGVAYHGAPGDPGP